MRKKCSALYGTQSGCVRIEGTARLGAGVGETRDA
jgi:hypothetical protein